MREPIKKLSLGYSSEITVNVCETCIDIEDIPGYCHDNHCCCGECWNSMAGEVSSDLEIRRDEIIQIAIAMGITPDELSNGSV